MRILVITDLYPINEDEKYTPKTIQAFVKCWEDLGQIGRASCRERV